MVHHCSLASLLIHVHGDGYICVIIDRANYRGCDSANSIQISIGGDLSTLRKLLGIEFLSSLGAVFLGGPCLSTWVWL